MPKHGREPIIHSPDVNISANQRIQSRKDLHRGDDGKDDPSLTEKGQKQCVDLFVACHQHSPFLTHILSSPMRRRMETAHSGLGASIREITVMPALAGRGQKKVWSLDEKDEEGSSYKSWVMKRPERREESMSDEEFVLMWLTLKGLSKEDDRKSVREVFVVSQDNFWRDCSDQVIAVPKFGLQSLTHAQLTNKNGF
jgi:hypothetical protein